MEKRVKLLGTFLDCLTMEETIERSVKAIENKENIQHVVINASKINLMKEDEDLRDIVNSCPIINADGQSIVWAGRFLGHRVPERVAGIDLFENLVRVSAEKGYKPYFFGAKQHVVKNVVAHYNSKYPELKIAGFRNGYFKKEESQEIAREIYNSGADILFVAFSSPMKEKWISENMPIMNVSFAMGVGGSFDVVAGETTRAPKWMQRIGLEWFHRFIQEPRRMFKRYIIGNLRFIYSTLIEKIN
ncbi:WecB/TagA/CpsF family glycosyltransferase [Gottfriedia acidiceleris]|uniref:WecB/TagA/CpsF family glycosyltransferase n=1 Tax=Gottfriedia acidiceleris TaxID=371036 RepID=UPI002FFF21C0